MITPVWNVEGVPELPAGFMYRVKHKAFGYVQVEVRKKRVFGSELRSRVVLVPGDFSTADQLLATGCELALVKAGVRRQTEILLSKASQYVGNHLSLEDK